MVMDSWEIVGKAVRFLKYKGTGGSGNYPVFVLPYDDYELALTTIALIWAGQDR